jgi:hypothetical protein
LLTKLNGVAVADPPATPIHQLHSAAARLPYAAASSHRRRDVAWRHGSRGVEPPPRISRDEGMEKIANLGLQTSRFTVLSFLISCL